MPGRWGWKGRRSQRPSGEAFKTGQVVVSSLTQPAGSTPLRISSRAICVSELSAWLINGPDPRGSVPKSGEGHAAVNTGVGASGAGLGLG